MNLTETEKAYLAGIIDGEGSICITRKKQCSSHKYTTYQPYIEITNLNKDLIDYISSKIPYAFKFTRPRTRINSRWRDAYTVQVTGLTHIIELLEQIKPYLIVKRQHAEVMIEYCKSRLRHCFANGKEKSYTEREIQLYKKLRTLNSKCKGTLRFQVKAAA